MELPRYGSPAQYFDILIVMDKYNGVCRRTDIINNILAPHPNLNLLSFDTVLIEMESKGLIAISPDRSSITLTEEGSDFSGVHFLAETDNILSDLFYNYDFAVLKYLYAKNGYVELHIFPKILINFNPNHDSVRNGKLDRFRTYLYLNENYITEKDGYYILSDFGEQYLYFLNNKLEKQLASEQRVIDERESVITTNSISKVNAIVTGIIAIVVLTIQIMSCQKENNKDIRETNKLNQDSLVNLQKAKTDSMVIQKISLILQGLSDSVKTK